MTRVLGVDGCRGGWVGALLDDDAVTWLRLPDVDAVLSVGADAVGIDMPIGLPPRGRRESDLLAKRLLGRAHPRVALTPPRAVLAAATYEEAGSLHRRLVDGKGLSRQTWHLLAEVAEVDRRADDPRLVEVHPELSFALLAGRVLPPKRTAEGRDARLDVLRRWRPGLTDAPPGDDAPDALAAAWSAARWLAGSARTLPADPPRDQAGRPMRIVS
jgi:predicted RNase H-like nuclease